ncbi:MAG: carboxypeptidase regulatory-like domain-containing protein [Myxococcales bacterium]|nr:carboxypeptidase regulatory-like domain-containing protein [Myxococcales bacterium]
MENLRDPGRRRRQAASHTHLGAALIIGILLAAPWAEAACVRGWVTGLSGQDAAFLNIEGGVSLRVQSQPGGQWEACGLSAGKYLVRPEHANYQFSPSSRTVVVREPRVQAVNFHAISRRAAGNPGAVKGRVEGLQKGQVVLLELACRIPVEGKSAKGGAFSLQPREPGACRLIPRDDRYRFVPVEMELEIEREPILGMRFLAEPSEGSAVPLEAPVDESGKPLVERPVYRLSGQVKGQKKGEKTLVRVSGPAEREAASGEDGRFVFDKLPGGRYRVEFRASECSGCRVLPQGMIVELDEDISGISAQIQRPGRGR